MRWLRFHSSREHRAFAPGWIGRLALSNFLAGALATLSGLAGIATYAVLTKKSALLGAQPETVSILVAIDLILLCMLALVVVWRVVVLLRARAQGRAGARLHLKLVIMFSLLAVMPAVLVAGLSAIFFFAGVQTWFSSSVSGAVRESTQVAASALEAHQRTILADAFAVANSLNREVGSIGDDERRMDQILNNEVRTRELADALVFDSSGKVLARSDLGFSIGFETVRDVDLERAKKGDVVLIANTNNTGASALLRLDRYLDSYLMVSRLTDPQLLAHLQAAEQASSEYAAFEVRRVELQRGIMMIFIIVALVLLFSAVLLGLNVANQLVRPIGALIHAADRVRTGDLTVRVTQTDRATELGTLIRSFNRMTNQLQTQRRELIETNRQLDERRRFTEAVLEGVSAGVLDTDSFGEIQLANSHACELLGSTPDDLVGRRVTDIMADMAPLFDEAHRKPGKQVDEQIIIKRTGQPARTLHVRLAPEMEAEDLSGFVITFDEITELVTAQRMAAWADVARRIAHEIKNPLTPIQLSAERLKRKYLKQITAEPEIFQECVDTIVRQVDDIRRMVDEFSAFARMPQAVIKPYNLSMLIREAVVLQREAHPDISFAVDLPEDDFQVPCDYRQIRQALTNLIQNAINAIHERPENGEPLPAGRVNVALQLTRDSAILTIADNGKGLPSEDRERLTEPYVTTRAKGTGLGLAIVKKIMEDHDATLSLEDNPTGGALIRLAFALDVVEQTQSDVTPSAVMGEADKANC